MKSLFSAQWWSTQTPSTRMSAVEWTGVRVAVLQTWCAARIVSLLLILSLFHLFLFVVVSLCFSRSSPLARHHVCTPPEHLSLALSSSACLVDPSCPTRCTVQVAAHIASPPKAFTCMRGLAPPHPRSLPAARRFIFFLFIVKTACVFRGGGGVAKPPPPPLSTIALPMPNHLWRWQGQVPTAQGEGGSERFDRC